MNPPGATCTVVIPCYNGREHLGAAVESVLAQSFGNFHLVLVDDASTDDSLSLMYRLAEHRPQISVVAQAVNGGRSAARNRGVEATRGPYLAFLDHDDAYHPDFLRETTTILNNLPHVDRVKVLPELDFDLDPVRYNAAKNSLVTTSLVRRDAFHFIGGWPESDVFRRHAHAGEDVAFEELFSSCFDTAWLNQKLYRYTRRPGNTFDQFLARTTVEGGELRFIGGAASDDAELQHEIRPPETPAARPRSPAVPRARGVAGAGPARAARLMPKLSWTLAPALARYEPGSSPPRTQTLSSCVVNGSRAGPSRADTIMP
jgi:glycosyltransferase involved in cell wall biosynthesis